jgi:hypothetical protein
LSVEDRQQKGRSEECQQSHFMPSACYTSMIGRNFCGGTMAGKR